MPFCFYLSHLVVLFILSLSQTDLAGNCVHKHSRGYEQFLKQTFKTKWLVGCVSRSAASSCHSISPSSHPPIFTRARGIYDIQYIYLVLHSYIAIVQFELNRQHKRLDSFLFVQLLLKDFHEDLYTREYLSHCACST